MLFTNPSLPRSSGCWRWKGHENKRRTWAPKPARFDAGRTGTRYQTPASPAPDARTLANTLALRPLLHPLPRTQDRPPHSYTNPGIPLSPCSRLRPAHEPLCRRGTSPSCRFARPPASPATEPLRRNDVRAPRVLRRPPSRTLWPTTVHRLRCVLVLMLMSKDCARAGRVRARDGVLMWVRWSLPLRQQIGACRARAGVRGSWLLHMVRSVLRNFVCQGGTFCLKHQIACACFRKESTLRNGRRCFKLLYEVGIATRVLMMQLVLRKGWRALGLGLGFVLCRAGIAQWGAGIYRGTPAGEIELPRPGSAPRTKSNGHP
jgi:hypothetical protein